MIDLGDHAHFIWLAYGAVALVLVALVLWLRADLRAQRTLLAELEPRRDKPPADTRGRPAARKQASRPARKAPMRKTPRRRSNKSRRR